jgi:hypothetical protein
MAADDPFEWVKDLRRTVPTSLVRQIVDDFRSYDPSPRSLTPPATVQIVGAGRTISGDDKPVASTGTGWADSPELKPPPGISLIDEMCAQEDASWRLQRAREVAEAAALKRAEAQFLATKAQRKPKGEHK